VGVGNIVRIPVTCKEHPTVTQTAYFRIIEHCGGKKFKGRVEDPYYGNLDWFFVKNGDVRLFSSNNIVEIPLDWSGNKNLDKKARHV